MMGGLIMERGVDVFLTGVAVKGVVLLTLAALAAVALRGRSAAGRHWAWLLGLVGLLALPVVGLVGPRWSLPVPARMLPGRSLRPAGGASGETAPRDPMPIAGLDPAADVSGGAKWHRSGRAAVAERLEGAASMDIEGGVAGGFGGASGPSGAGSPVAAGSAGSLRRAGVRPGIRPPEGASPAYGSGRDNALIPPVVLLLALWMGGAAALMLRLLGSHLAVRRLAGQAGQFPHGRVAEAARSLADRVGLERPVRLLQGPAHVIPMSWGIRRPTVLLPTGAEGWSGGRLEAVLLHEYAHVRRRDCLAQLLAEVAVAIHWFNPLAWIAVHRLRVEREHACDDEVLTRGTRATQYATELVALAREIRFGSAPSAAVAVLGPADLGTRIRAVLDARRSRTLTARAAVWGATLAVAVVLAVATATPALARSGGGTAAVPATDPGFPTPMVSAVIETPVLEQAPWRLSASTPFLQAASCGLATEGWQRSSSRSDDHDHYRLEWSRSGCSVDVRVEGDVDFAEDFRGVARLASGAFVRIEEVDGGTRRWLEVTAGPGGRPEFEYRVDGQGRDFDAAARAWYSAMTLQVVRRSGFRAEERVAAMLRSGGVPAVLAELELLTSDHVFASYTEQLILQADLTEAQAIGLVERARTRVDSDHYMAGILMALADRNLTSPRGVDVFLEGASTLESDHYRAQVLGHALEHRTITPAQVATLIDAVAGMESDHYVAEVLMAVAGRYFLDEGMRATYLRAVRGVESDHYRTEILGALLDRNDLSGEEMSDVLAAVAQMSSDHYKTELLKRFATDPLSSAEMDQYIGIVASMGSDHYKSEALVDLSLRDLSDAQLMQVIGAVETIESDHYQAALLVRIADQSRVHQGALYDAMIRAMNTVESKHYRGQVAESLLRR